jgi:hypothetical protein
MTLYPRFLDAVTMFRTWFTHRLRRHPRLVSALFTALILPSQAAAVAADGGANGGNGP